MKMKKQEKMRIIKEAVSYARINGCLICDSAEPNKSRKEIIIALSRVGLTAKEVDKATKVAGIVDGGGSLGLFDYGILRGCTDVDKFLKVIERML